MELLRIVATLFVIVLHYNNKNNGKAFVYTEALQMHYQILAWFEMLAICAVNIFVMISGYFMCHSRKVQVTKVFRLFLDTVFCNAIRYLLNCALKTTTFAVSNLLKFMIPLSWYVAVYAALYLLSPFINKLIRELTAGQFRILLCVLLAVFSVWPSALELITALTGIKLTSMCPLGTQGSGAGYTIVHFVVMYLVGAYLRMHADGKKDTRFRWDAAGIYVLCTALLVLYSKVYFSGALSDCNPLVIMQSVAFFMVFQSVRIQSKAVNAIAGCSFGVYLLHTNFFRYVRIEQYVTGSIFLIPVHILLAALWIYGVSAVIYAVYQKTLGFLIGRGLSRLHFLKYEVN